MKPIISRHADNNDIVVKDGNGIIIANFSIDNDLPNKKRIVNAKIFLRALGNYKNGTLYNKVPVESVVDNYRSK